MPPRCTRILLLLQLLLLQVRIGRATQTGNHPPSANCLRPPEGIDAPPQSAPFANHSFEGCPPTLWPLYIGLNLPSDSSTLDTNYPQLLDDAATQTELLFEEPLGT